MEKELSDVERDRTDPGKVMETFRSHSRRIPEHATRNVDQTAVADRTRRHGEYGPRPECGNPVVKTGRIRQCPTNRNGKQPDGTWKKVEGRGWKPFGTINGRKLTDANVKTPLDKGGARLKGFTARNGNTFDATLIPDPEHGCRFDFADHGKDGR